MQIQPINKTMSQSTFKAKLSVKTLKTLTEEAKSFEQGNEDLKNILDKIEKIGNKNTILDFGIVTENTKTEHYRGSAAFDYMDEEDYEVKYKQTDLTLSNYIFPNAFQKFTIYFDEKDNLFSFLKKSLFEKNYDNNIREYVEPGEVDLFEKYITDFKEKSPEKLATKETFDLIDVIKNGFKPNQSKQMVVLATKMDSNEILNKLREISTEINKLEDTKQQLHTRLQQTGNLADSMSKILEDNSKNETKEIYDRYI